MTCCAGICGQDYSEVNINPHFIWFSLSSAPVQQHLFHVFGVWATKRRALGYSDSSSLRTSHTASRKKKTRTDLCSVKLSCVISTVTIQETLLCNLAFTYFNLTLMFKFAQQLLPKIKPNIQHSSAKQGKS